MSKTKLKAGEYVVALPKIRVDRGDHHEELTRGDSCESVPQDTLETMIRLGQAVTRDELEASEATLEPEQVETDWRSTPVADLSLTENITAALTEAGLVTIADVLAFGAEKGTLTEIKGVGKASEKEIQEAIQAAAQAVEA